MQIKDLLNHYLLEANSGQFDYVKALADFQSRDESTLNFRKGEIIAVVPKHDAYTEKVGIKLIPWDIESFSFSCLGSTNALDFPLRRYANSSELWSARVTNDRFDF